MKKKHKKIIVPSIFIILLGILAVLTAWLLLTKPAHAPVKPVSPFYLPLPLVSPSPLPRLDYAHPTVKTITIKTTADLTKSYANPPITLITNGGHYLFQDNGFNPTNRFSLSYDGDILYEGYALNVYNNLTTLSPNGLHYGYVVEEKDTNQEIIYVDQKKVGVSKGPLGNLVVADSGDYYYTISRYSSIPAGSANKLHLYKNNKEIYSFERDRFGASLTVSPDGKHYILWTREYLSTEGKTRDHFVIDGKETIIDNRLRDVYFSKNWQHYAIITEEGYGKSKSTLAIDGQIVKEITGVLPFGELLDNGKYSYYLPGPVIDNGSYPFPVIDGETFPYSIRNAYMTEDGEHILTVNEDNKWEFDEKPLPITISPKYDRVQMIGNTIYVYHITN